MIMTDIQQLVDTLSATARSERQVYHLLLGDLIDQLVVADDDLLVCENTGSDTFGYGTCSYRGFYEDLAFVRREDRVITVGEFLDLCNRALGMTYEGYKGGDFTMEADAPLWITHDASSSASNTAVMGCRVTEHNFVLMTKELKY